MVHYRHSVFLLINLDFQLLIAKAYTQPTPSINTGAKERIREIVF